MGLNTYPSNPFPPSTDRMDADALEAEVSKLNNDVSELRSGLTNVNTALSVPEGTGKNIFDKDNIDSIKKYYDGANWINQSSNQWKTIFIPVIAGRTYTSSGFPHTSGAASVFVKADKSTVLLTLASANNNSTFVVPDMAEYVGFAIWSPDEDYTSAQLELGSIATAYTPYIPSVESRIEAVESGVGVIVTEDKSYQYTVNANAGINITAEDFEIVTPTGYTPIAFARVVTGNDNVIIRNMSPIKTGSTTMLGMFNTSSSAVTATAIVQIVYVKTGAIIH